MGPNPPTDAYHGSGPVVLVQPIPVGASEMYYNDDFNNGFKERIDFEEPSKPSSPDICYKDSLPSPVFSDPASSPVFSDPASSLVFSDSSSSPVFSDPPSSPIFSDPPSSPVFSDLPSSHVFSDSQSSPVFSDHPSSPVFSETPSPLTPIFLDPSPPPVFTCSTPSPVFTGKIHEKSKIIVLGDAGVGKTSLIQHYKYGQKAPVNRVSTICADFVDCVVDSSDCQRFPLAVWDTAGQERYKCMLPLYMRNTTAALIVYDITCRKSFEAIDSWISELIQCCPEDTEPIIMLIGNKLDNESQRAITTSEGALKASTMKAYFFELSTTHDNSGVQKVFLTLADAIASRNENLSSSKSAGVADEIKSLKDNADADKCLIVQKSDPSQAPFISSLIHFLPVQRKFTGSNDICCIQ